MFLFVGGASVPEMCSSDDETDGYQPDQPTNGNNDVLAF